MKAWQFTNTHEPLVLNRRDRARRTLTLGQCSSSWSLVERKQTHLLLGLRHGQQQDSIASPPCAAGFDQHDSGIGPSAQTAMHEYALLALKSWLLSSSWMK